MANTVQTCFLCRMRAAKIHSLVGESWVQKVDVKWRTDFPQRVISNINKDKHSRREGDCSTVTFSGIALQSQCVQKQSKTV